MFTHNPQETDINSDTSAPHQPAQPPLSETRIRTALPSGPRLENSLSLPGIKSLIKNDMQTNIGCMLSTPNRDRYTSVQALLLFWQDDDETSEIQSAVRELADVFDEYYHYSFQIQAIPSSENNNSSWIWLSQQLNDFIKDGDQRDVLKIIYYAGHTYLDGNRQMVLACSRDHERSSTIQWGGIQQFLEEVCADTLIIMDSAYYPSARIVRPQGVLELIAASVSDEHFYSLDRYAFTRALAKQLRTRPTRQSSLSAAELHSNLFAYYPRIVQERNPEKEAITSYPGPLHMMMSGNSTLPSIFLSPLSQSSPMRNRLSFENNPQLHLSIRLIDGNVDVDSWNEWLRLMPKGVENVKVEGSFLATFR
ncbi:hypothetical protein EDB81DRAFT_362206 [Dactylonectria macrodidyma]|uniref:Uncharacterized protein n=1 Tax=Dactylonectria macrodidyma TaxID=307937 RepID=A0A9P9I9N2_9HYPO|nr:hypothetical protein EDB81DRAFT_362206 [Dactylonectria macrodidyma]